MRHALFHTLAVALVCTTLLGGRAAAQVPHFHKVFTDNTTLFDAGHYKQSMVTTATNIFTAVESTAGVMLMKTDLSGNVVWNHLLGDARTSAPTLILGVGDNLILGTYNVNYDAAVVSKIDPGTGNVLWSKRYYELEELITLTQRGDRYVAMGNSYYGNGRIKPLAISINDSDGSVAWAKLYLEVTASYTTDYDHFIRDATVNPNRVVFTGVLYNGINISAARPRVTMLSIDASTGNVPSGAMHSYDMSWSATGDPLKTGAEYGWDIADVKMASGAMSGFLLAGTYPLATYGAPAVVRLNQDGVVQWAKFYRSSNSNSGFGRTARQNDFFNAGRLDFYTSWDFYQNAIDGTGTASGLMRLNEVDGSVAGMTVYDAPGYYAGLSMHSDGAGGYLLHGSEDTYPARSFELLKVGQIGGNVTCTAEDTTLTTQSLTVTDLSIALTSPSISVDPVDTPLTWVDRALAVTDCACP
jgi:hypothetical protein